MIDALGWRSAHNGRSIVGARHVEIEKTRHAIILHDAARIDDLLAEHFAAAECAQG